MLITGGQRPRKTCDIIPKSQLLNIKCLQDVHTRKRANTGPPPPFSLKLLVLWVLGIEIIGVLWVFFLIILKIWVFYG